MDYRLVLHLQCRNFFIKSSIFTPFFRSVVEKIADLYTFFIIALFLSQEQEQEEKKANSLPIYSTGVP